MTLYLYAKKSSEQLPDFVFAAPAWDAGSKARIGLRQPRPLWVILSKTVQMYQRHKSPVSATPTLPFSEHHDMSDEMRECPMWEELPDGPR